MTYRIVISRPAQRDLRGIRDREVRQRMASAIESLAENPRPQQAQRLRGAGEVWRIRVGDWRICYTVEADELIVLILIVGQRGDVYERLRRRLG